MEKQIRARLEELRKHLQADGGDLEVVEIKDKDVKVAQELVDNMRQLDFALVDQGLGTQMEIMLLTNFNDEFDTLDWKDRNRARITLDRGLQMAANNPTKEALRPIIIELYRLLPPADQPPVPGGGGGVGTK